MNVPSLRPGLFLTLCTCAVATLSPASLPAATLSVPADHATVQAAIESASANDVIEITDGNVYAEDLNIDKPLTIRGTAAQRPVVRAANVAARFEHLGIAGADRLGTLVRAPGIVLERLRFENMDNIPNAEDISSALTIIAPNCTVRDCEITGVESTSFDSVGGVIADLDVPVGGATPTGVLLEDCHFFTNKYGFANSWFVLPQAPAECTVRNCVFTGNSSAGLTIDSGNVTIQNCRFEDNSGNGLNVGGGHAEVSDSVFTGNTQSYAIVLSADARWDDNPGTIPPGSISMSRCLVYGNGQAGTPAIGVHEGSLVANHCILANNFSHHIWMDTSGSTVNPALVTLDHCDLYRSEASHEIYIAGGGDQEISFQILNSIVTEGDGGQYALWTDLVSPEQIPWQVASHSAFYEQFIPDYLGITETNNLFFPSGEPAYNSTDPTQPDSFTLPENSPLLTAGLDGTYLGSRGTATEEPATFDPPALQNGKVLLSWTGTGTLQEKTSLDGTWTNSASQNNPQEVDPAGAHKFFRVMSP